MERKAFCRPADDFDVMGPLSDSDGADEEILAPRHQKAMAVVARRKGASFANSFSQKEKPAAKPERKPERMLWADITTDDEDIFPTWSPAPKQPAVEQAVEKAAASGPRGYDKWSWSTTATSMDDLEQELPAEDTSPTAASQASGKEFSSFSSNVSEAPEVPQAPQPLPAQCPAPVAVPQGMAVQMPVPQPHMQMVAVPAMQYAPWGMGMLPVAMAAMPHFPMQLATNHPAMLRTMPHEEKEQDELPRPLQLSGALVGGPPFGRAHRFHQKNTTMGILSEDARIFTKKQNKGRLSIVCENKVHFHGTVRYAVQFTDGELCSADGVGFILSSDLPCTKNIQKIVSVFANRTGRICIRVHEEVERCPQRVKCLEVGDWLEVNADLAQQTVSFTVWPKDGSEPSHATVSFKDILNKARGRVSGLPRNPCGYLAAVIKHVGVSVTFGS